MIHVYIFPEKFLPKTESSDEKRCSISVDKLPARVNLSFGGEGLFGLSLPETILICSFES